jgi:hypothetical protein
MLCIEHIALWRQWEVRERISTFNRTLLYYVSRSCDNATCDVYLIATALAD